MEEEKFTDAIHVVHEICNQEFTGGVAVRIVLLRYLILPKHLFDRNNLDVAIALSNLALLYSSSGHYKEVEALKSAPTSSRRSGSMRLSKRMPLFSSSSLFQPLKSCIVRQSPNPEGHDQGIVFERVC